MGESKAFDGSAVFSKFINFEGDVKDLSFKLYINGELTQEGDYSLMIHKPQEIIDEINRFMTLKDGDIIMSGTPKGVGSYKVGDRFKAIIFEKDNKILEWETRVV